LRSRAVTWRLDPSPKVTWQLNAPPPDFSHRTLRTCVDEREPCSVRG